MRKPIPLTELGELIELSVALPAHETEQLWQQLDGRPVEGITPDDLAHMRDLSAGLDTIEDPLPTLDEPEAPFHLIQTNTQCILRCTIN